MRPTRTLFLTSLLLVTALTGCATGKDDSYGPELQGFQYPYPVERFKFRSQGQSLQMGYMDVAPTGKPLNRTIVLMHGKNFCGATWDNSIRALSADGFRVGFFMRVSWARGWRRNCAAIMPTSSQASQRPQGDR